LTLFGVIISLTVWKNRFVWICLILVLAGLALLAYQGVYNRYWADDWCYDASVLHRGLVGAVQGYFDTATYATNRVSLTLFSGFLAPLWVPGVELLPLAVILLWLGGLYWNLRLLARLFQPALAPQSKAGLDRKTSLLGAAVLLTFILWLAPNQFQILMWRTGLLTYTAPLLGLTWLAGRFVLQALEPARGWRGTAVAGLLSFIIGGFSEVGCALLLSSLALGLALVLAFRRRLAKSVRRALVPMLAAALVAGLAAMVVLVLSPMNTPRRLISYAAPMPLAELPFMALKFGYLYIRAFLSLNRWAVLALGAGGVIFGLFAAQNGISLRRLAAGLLLTGGVVFLLIAAINVPAAYIENAEISESRALLVPTTVMLAGVAAAAWQVGSALRRWRPAWALRPAPALAPLSRAGLVLVLALAALAPTAYAVSKYPAALAPIALFQKRAQVWDERDAAIRAAFAAGQSSVDVRQIDSYASILEFYPQPNWVNNCAASFYGMSEIRATLPWNQ
jgi:hypothetical protein